MVLPLVMSDVGEVELESLWEGVSRNIVEANWVEGRLRSRMGRMGVLLHIDSSVKCHKLCVCEEQPDSGPVLVSGKEKLN